MVESVDWEVVDDVGTGILVLAYNVKVVMR
jgi:hypothetical protein